MDAYINSFRKNSSIDYTINGTPSKSYLHRALLASFLSDGLSVINLNDCFLSNDINDTISIIKSLGCNVSFDGKSIMVSKDEVKKCNDFTILESASTLRFFIPLLLFLQKKFRVKCKESLLLRPITVYSDIIRECKIIKDKDSFTFDGDLKPGCYYVDGTISSQFISGMLFALPLLDGDSELICSNVTSIGYINMTIDVLNKFGIIISTINNNESITYKICGGQSYKSTTIDIENDYSQVANFVTLGLFFGNISILGMNLKSLQKDIDFLFMDSIKKYVTLKENTLTINKANDLNNLIFDIKDNPDLGPILFVLISIVSGKVTSINRLKYKESNRILSITEELKKLNINMKIDDESFTAMRSKVSYSELVFDSHNDHRVCMALTALALIIYNGIEGIKIRNIECVNKSYPNFFNDLNKLGFMIEMR